ncbi:MAG: antibiotic biosynthesis monooxygenase [Sphingomonas sp.]|uniref:antibiotic biosynthesis monooxygenase family protein n=1 Tax=Sphingomonas sp. TaxID=28214 RepID=UPI0017943873|nr:antibiotic biosynthesis monooxygenase [Sphingomonas sp.]MBA3668362.1 antibiotic biosynthesis monooxygenase [Sphingomonas sp.]
MIAVLFEVIPVDGQAPRYLELAAELAPPLKQADGFISIERFRSLTDPDKMLSLSFWRDEEAVAAWRNQPAHRATQAEGRAETFRDYRLRVAEVIRDYGLDYGLGERKQAPVDSRVRHGK